MVAYTRRYSSGLLIPNSATMLQIELYKCPLEYLRASVGYHPCFFTFYLFIWSLLPVKLQIFPYTCYLNITLCKEELLACVSMINYWSTNKPVCFVLSYVLSVTQQYKQKTAWKVSLQSIQPCYETSSTLLKLRCYGFHVLRYGHAFHEYILRIFRNGWIYCRDAFHAVICLYCCITDKK